MSSGPTTPALRRAPADASARPSRDSVTTTSPSHPPQRLIFSTHTSPPLKPPPRRDLSRLAPTHSSPRTDTCHPSGRPGLTRPAGRWSPGQRSRVEADQAPRRRVPDRQAGRRPRGGAGRNAGMKPSSPAAGTALPMRRTPGADTVHVPKAGLWAQVHLPCIVTGRVRHRSVGTGPLALPLRTAPTARVMRHLHHRAIAG